ncbi:MAG: hypothetical protein OXT74_12740 [Candidatus Poribacteria bacterium]|nr:hypothetical protein [Candidatus Poribacteria bacterium]
MRFLRSTHLCTLLTCCTVLVLIAESGFGQLPPAPQLALMQTADTLGKGGYTTAFGHFQFQKGRVIAENQSVEIGNFEELHTVELNVQTFLMPIRFTYGIDENLDLILGGTFSTGGVRKTVYDFYETGDPDRDRRVYDQALFDTVVGLKYGIKPDDSDGLPKIAIGGDVQIGYSADNRLSGTGDFLDPTPADGFPFVGVNTYILGALRFGEYVRGHAGVGMFLSSKSFRATDSFLLNWQLGGEVLLTHDLWLVGDFSRELPLAGMTISNQLSVGVRYEISNRASFHFGYVSEPGFQFSLAVGGEKSRMIAPAAPKRDEIQF